MARKLHVARVWQIEYKYPGMYGGDGGCVKTLTQPFFYAQSPDFLKPGLCYYPKFSYL